MKNIPKEMRSKEKDDQGKELIKIFLKIGDREKVLKQFNEITGVVKDLFNLIK